MRALPAEFQVELDASVRVYRDDTLLVGGDPGRVLRLTAAGSAALKAIRGDRLSSEATRRLAGRLVDSGLAHPRPPRRALGPDLTVVVPVRDRPAGLARCLGALGPDTRIIVVDDASIDTAAIAAVCERHRAWLVRLGVASGPGAARNAALPHVETELIAFLDSDCVPGHDWLGPLQLEFADPLVGAVAPRVRPLRPVGPMGLAQRFLTARSPLDMGETEARVAPFGRVPYVPAAALVVRRRAIADGFDPSLRYGEDVDLVWRLHDEGWRVRYLPRATAGHAEPASWRALLRRRMLYGTSAAPLSQRHRGRLAPLVAQPWSGAAVTVASLLAVRRPGSVLGVGGAAIALGATRLRARGVPFGNAVRYAAGTAVAGVLAVGRTATMLATPALLVGLCGRRTRLATAALLALPPLEEWVRRRPQIDPVRWTIACVLDDAAYGAGVWKGCMRERTIAPLVPVRRSRLRTTLPDGDPLATPAAERTVARPDR